MNINMKGKKIIVTGGSTGIGREVVKIFAENEAKVAIFDVNNEEGMSLTNDLNKKNLDIRYWNVDVRDSNQVSGGVLAATQWLKGIGVPQYLCLDISQSLSL